MIKENRAQILANYQNCNRLLRSLLADMPEVVINSPENGCPHILNISVPGIPSEIMLHALEEKGIYVSSGSACSKGALSGVLAAFHLPQERIRSALRISFSYETDESQLRTFAAALREVIDRLMKVVKAN